MRRELRAEA
uniref:Uncharacterized protein n=1 Tax=Arundo donax TaxID=35708 RepID=A0A0A9BAD1_ARUDO